MIKVKISEALECAGIAITIISKRGNEYEQVLPFRLTFTPVELGSRTTPCLVLHSEQADELLHALAQGLVEAGYFPDIIQDKQNELRATNYHLEDMRSLVFKKE